MAPIPAQVYSIATLEVVEVPVEVVDAGEGAEAVEGRLEVLDAAEQDHADGEADAVQREHLEWVSLIH